MDNNNKLSLKCATCNFSSFWDFSLQKHYKRNHQTLRTCLFNCNLAFIENFVCPDSDYGALLKVNFDNHLRRGHDWDNPEFIYKIQEDINPQEWDCPDCPFKTYSRFLNHAHRDAHSYKEEAEEEDEFKFETKIEIFEEDMNIALLKIKEENNLNADAHLPVTEETFECERCSFKTKYKGNFNLHVHMMHKPSNRVNDQSSLRKHITYRHKSKHQIKQFACAHCPYKGKRNEHLKYHIMSKHTPDDKIEWFKCNHCSYKGKSKSSLRRHKIQIHKPNDEIKWFYCAQCLYKSKRNDNLKTHTLRKHT